MPSPSASMPSGTQVPFTQLSPGGQDALVQSPPSRAPASKGSMIGERSSMQPGARSSVEATAQSKAARMRSMVPHGGPAENPPLRRTDEGRRSQLIGNDHEKWRSARRASYDASIEHDASCAREAAALAVGER